MYADYSQFEPGILASLSNDIELVNCYNNHDLYSTLSETLFGTAERRGLCKTVFLSFMYGMSIPNLENLLNDFFKDKNISSELNSFFKKFNSLLKYKDELGANALNNGNICSQLGNYRYLDLSDKTSLQSEAKRWLLSQKIQGTASLILKTGILKCSEDSEVEFLIPMHDAALFQVPESKAREKEEFIHFNFKESMKLYCPRIEPKIIFKGFDE